MNDSITKSHYRYERLRQLGEGTYGVVFEARRVPSVTTSVSVDINTVAVKRLVRERERATNNKGGCNTYS
jgi:hypothetical protein